MYSQTWYLQEKSTVTPSKTSLLIEFCRNDHKCSSSTLIMCLNLFLHSWTKNVYSPRTVPIDFVSVVRAICFNILKIVPISACGISRLFIYRVLACYFGIQKNTLQISNHVFATDTGYIQSSKLYIVPYDKLFSDFLFSSVNTVNPDVA